MHEQPKNVIRLHSLVGAITEVATCSESEDVNLAALSTLGQVLSPGTEPYYGRRPKVPGPYNAYPEYPRIAVTDEDALPSDES